ncbi:hypothetical protein P280DRAFT_466851 [Massarina eburnea CBS 473.64]|uniref:CSI2 protein n=1 Tax=Massarina eburnea CBS 473.64 TaxID=1395130 RepID=A0A6A6S8K2_9PLEO|nr:hypothetical protein P280DRAFT_466851 [Massarina eburnea CBS 473.64]
MRLFTGLVGLLLVAAPAALAQDSKSASATDAQSTEAAKPTDSAKSTDAPSSSAANTKGLTDAPDLTSSSSSSASSSPAQSATTTASDVLGVITDAPSIAGVGVPTVQIPNTAGAPYMQKSNLPDGTVFICVGALLAFLGAAVLAWRGLVAWSLHRSVKRAAMAQNMADLKAMSAVPGKKRGMYNVVGASSNMSLDHLAAAPTGTSRPVKPFASSNPTTSAPPRTASSLFFSPTAGGSTGLRDSVVNRSSTYLPAGYYGPGNAQPAQGSPVTHVGGNNHSGHLSTYSLHAPGNRYSSRSGISPPVSPSLPPSRGYDRAPPSRDGMSMYNRNSVATLGVTPSQQQRGTVYQNDNNSNPSQLSLNAPGGTHAPGGRAPSAYLDDLFESHGNGSRDRF